MADERLSALDIRVLMAVAAHDRLGKNGIGCFANHTRLSTLVGCHIKSLSRSLSTLAQCGYLEGSLHPLNKKTRVYRVLYTALDEGLMRTITSKKGNEPATHDPVFGNEPATENPPIGNNLAPNGDWIGNQPSKNIVSDQQDTDGNIFCEAEKRSSETEIIDPAEAAPSPISSDGELLARIERNLKSGEISSIIAKTTISIVEKIMDRSEYGQHAYHRAERVLGELYEAFGYPEPEEHLDVPF